jgi:hypothetical protein
LLRNRLKGYEACNTMASDYTIMIRNLRLNVNKNDLEEFLIKNSLPEREVKINHIFLVSNLGEFQANMEKQLKLLHEVNKIQEQNHDKILD